MLAQSTKNIEKGEIKPATKAFSEMEQKIKNKKNR